MIMMRCGLFLLLMATAGLTAAGDSKIAVLYFSNTCSFKTQKWQIEKDVPKFMLSHIVGNKVSFIPFEKILAVLDKRKSKELENKEVEALTVIGKELGANYLILGDISKFKIEKKTAVMPDVGGYKQYTTEVEIKLWFFDCDLADITYETVLTKSIARRGLKFNPPGRISEDEDDYLRLENETFGSPIFMKTVIGETMLRLTQDFEEKVMSFINYGTDNPPAKQVPVLISEAKILQIDGSDAFINAGKDDNIKNGDLFDVYTQGEAVIDSSTGQKLGFSEVKVGKIKVAQVKASHFSRVKLLEGEGKIKVMDIVRIR